MTDIPAFPCEAIRNYDDEGRLVESGVLWGERGARLGPALMNIGRDLGPIVRYRAMIFTRDDRTLLPRGLPHGEDISEAPLFSPSRITVINSEARPHAPREMFHPYVVNIVTNEGDKATLGDRMLESDAFKLAFQLNKAWREIRAAVDDQFETPDPARRPLYPSRQALLAPPDAVPPKVPAKKQSRVGSWVISIILIFCVLLTIPALIQRYDLFQHQQFADSTFAYLDGHSTIIVPAYGGCEATLAGVMPRLSKAERETACVDTWKIAQKVSLAYPVLRGIDYTYGDSIQAYQISTDFQAGALLSGRKGSSVEREDGRHFATRQFGIILPPNAH